MGLSTFSLLWPKETDSTSLLKYCVVRFRLRNDERLSTAYIEYASAAIDVLFTSGGVDGDGGRITNLLSALIFGDIKDIIRRMWRDDGAGLKASTSQGTRCRCLRSFRYGLEGGLSRWR